MAVRKQLAKESKQERIASFRMLDSTVPDASLQHDRRAQFRIQAQRLDRAKQQFDSLIATLEDKQAKQLNKLFADVRQLHAQYEELARQHEVLQESDRRARNNIMSHMRRDIVFNPNLSSGLGVPLPRTIAEQNPQPPPPPPPPPPHAVVYPATTLTSSTTQRL